MLNNFQKALVSVLVHSLSLARPNLQARRRKHCSSTGTLQSVVEVVDSDDRRFTLFAVVAEAI